MKGHYHKSSGLKHKMVGVHLQVSGPILQLMELSDNVKEEQCTPCPLSPISFLASIPKLPPSQMAVLCDATPTKSQRLEKTITPEKLVHGTGDDMGLGNIGEGNSMGQGKGHPTMSQLMGHVPDAIAAEGIPQVSGDCHHDQEISVDENGYPTIFGSILSAEVAVDEDGYPIFFGAIIAGGNEAMQDDDSLPSIKPINPNGRARKLEVNAAAKALQEDDVANGVAPPVKKKNERQAVK